MTTLNLNDISDNLYLLNEWIHKTNLSERCSNGNNHIYIIHKICNTITIIIKIKNMFVFFVIPVAINIPKNDKKEIGNI